MVGRLCLCFYSIIGIIGQFLIKISVGSGKSSFSATTHKTQNNRRLPMERDCVIGSRSRFPITTGAQWQSDPIKVRYQTTEAFIPKGPGRGCVFGTVLWWRDRGNVVTRVLRSVEANAFKGTVHPQIKLRVFPFTRHAIYSSILFWCELPSLESAFVGNDRSSLWRCFGPDQSGGKTNRPMWKYWNWSETASVKPNTCPWVLSLG